MPISRKKKKKGYSISIDRQAASLAIEIAKSKKPLVELSTLRENVSSNDYNLVLKALAKYPNKRLLAVNGRGNESVSDLTGLIIPTALDLDKELKWARATFLSQSHSINDYLEMSSDFSQNFLLGKFKNADEALEKIERKLGQSLWLIKNKIAFLQLTQGLEAQKQYVQELKEAVSFKGKVAFISHWVSVRNEGTVTPGRYSSQIDAVFNKSKTKDNDGFQSYLKYHVKSNENIAVKDAVHILRRDFTVSLIDYYEAFLVVARAVIVNGNNEARTSVSYALEKVIAVVNDDRLRVLLASLGKSNEFPRSPFEANLAYNCFVRGDYEQAFSLASESLSKYPDDAVSIFILSLTNSILENDLISNDKDAISKPEDEDAKIEEPLNQVVINKLSLVARHGISATQEFNELTKLAVNFTTFSWVSAIDLMFIKENEFIGNYSNSSIINALKVSYVHPLMLEVIGKSKFGDNYSECCKMAYAENCGLNYSLAKIHGIDNGVMYENISTEALSLLECERLYKLEDYKGVIEKSSQLLEAKGGFYKRKGTRFITRALLQDQQIEELCRYIANCYITQPRLYAVLPLAEVVNMLSTENEHWKALCSTPVLSIVLDAYTKHVSKDKEAELGYACEDFLISNGFERPSDIGKYEIEQDFAQKVYYLRYICVESVIDTAIGYTGSDDVTAERLKICRLLSEVDTENLEIYKEEIRNLVRRQVIGSRMQEVEQSKIYVDVAKVKEWATKELQESYSRYIAYLKHGLDAITIAKREEARALAADADIEKLVAMSVPDNEVNALFKHIVLELRDAYASSYEFGLDRYISTRIRHGGIENPLRRPLDEFHLITKREGEKGPYKPNTYWLSELDLDNEQALKLENIFSQFAFAYDGLISLINTEWLQVRRSIDEGGLFNFIMVDGEISLIASRIDEQTSFSQMVDLILTYLGERLTESLTEIRKKLATEAKPVARDLITFLQMQLASLSIDDQLSELNAGINITRTVIQDVFDKVIEWFSPSESGGSSSYEIEDAVSVAEAIVQESLPGFTAPFIMRDGNLGLVIQGALPMFVDVLVNAFENVVRHSGLEKAEAEVIVWHELVPNNIRKVSINIVNNLGESVNIDAVNDKIARINALLESGKYGRTIATEGGSGSFKIHRSLSDIQASTTELKAKMKLEIIDNRFIVNIEIPMRQLSEHSTSEDVISESNL